MKATATAPANIAFIKYWGKKDEELRLPMNSSISMNLSDAYTITTVEFFKDVFTDEVVFLDDLQYKMQHVHENVLLPGRQKKERQRVVDFLDRLRAKVGVKLKAKVFTKNNFPKSSGVASSASGFAALTLAAASALELNLTEKELTILARIGSGSACRSIPDGFVIWEEGKSSETSYSRSLYPADYWDLRDILIIVKNPVKKIPTTVGMEAVKTSPFFTSRLLSLPLRMKKVMAALKSKDFGLLGQTLEEECVNMHAVMMTQSPPLFYWNTVTLEIIKTVQQWRDEGVEVYFTIDAGPNVHLICENKNEKAVRSKIRELKDVERVIVNKPARGAHLVNTHLF